MLIEQNNSVGNVSFIPEDQFFRRIPPWHLKGPRRVSSAAFDNDKDTNAFSANWQRKSSIKHTINDFPGFGVASFTAELCYSLNQEPKYTPKEDNSAHCDIIGRKTQSVTKKFRDGVKYLLYPGDKLDS